MEYNQIINDQRPQFFGTILILKRKPFFKGCYKFDVTNENNTRYQMYVSQKKINSISREILFIEACPKVIVFQTEIQTVILQQHVNETLQQYLSDKENQKLQYLTQKQSQNILIDITDSLRDYAKNKIQHNSICIQNICRIKQKWYLSLAGLLTKPNINGTNISDINKKYIYSLGVLLFQILFGFPPFQVQKKNNQKFTIKTYLQHLQNQQQHQNLKVYNFLRVSLLISQVTKDLLEKSLNMEITLQDWVSHPFFELGRSFQVPKISNIQVKMIHEAGNKYYSLTMASIEYRKKYPREVFHQHHYVDLEDKTANEIKQYFSKRSLFKQIQFAPNFENFDSFKDLSNVIVPTSVSSNLNYFYQKDFDASADRPCHQLMKFIDSDLSKYSGDDARRRQQILKLYAYPYTMIFELAKIRQKQPITIVKKIDELSLYLLQLSALYNPKNIKYLHNGSPSFDNFDVIKIKFRTLINEIYRHCMAQAIRKYNNVQLNVVSERIKLKEEGLQYYRLCLKLLELSLLVRKGGKKLDLQRIETSERRQIQQDLDSLLKEYFPNKAQLH